MGGAPPSRAEDDEKDGFGILYQGERIDHVDQHLEWCGGLNRVQAGDIAQLGERATEAQLPMGAQLRVSLGRVFNPPWLHVGAEAADCFYQL